MSTPIAPSADDARVLAEHGQTEAVELILADLNGILRGKRIAFDALGKVFEQGVCLPMSLIGTDITGNTVEETGLGYDIGDADRVCRPVPGTLRPVPWARVPTLQLLLGMEDLSGAPFAAHPRQVLSAVLDRYAARGWTPVLAVELEFYLLDAQLDATGHPRTPINPATGTRQHATQVYALQDLDDFSAFTAAVTAACRTQGIPADTAVAEYAPGQFEVNLHHRADALAACDDALMLKRAVKAVAACQGMQASFMAKPFAHHAGSGMHLHLSVLDGEGRNLFHGTPEAPAPALLHAIGGLQRHVQDCMLIFAPHANSYRRFVPNAFVPLHPCWGFNNRTVAMRVPYSDPANTRIEHRIAGADANPYLVAAAVLAAALDGIEQAMDPGPPLSGNAYAQRAPQEPYWRQSVERFLASAFVAEHLGTTFRHVFGQQKLKELRSFEREITSLEVDWYLRHV
ncbi:MAG: glutamine synthetase [Lysobacteraceae bacterium]|nr:MAG: glutamine synthetase [Xanthomonadaceae bacterium]